MTTSAQGEARESDAELGEFINELADDASYCWTVSGERRLRLAAQRLSAKAEISEAMLTAAMTAYYDQCGDWAITDGMAAALAAALSGKEE